MVWFIKPNKQKKGKIMTEEQNIENVETSEKVENTTTNIHTVSVDLSKEQYDFLVKWQKTHESELGIDVQLGSMVRKSVDVAMKSQKEDSDRKPGGFGDRKPGGFGDRRPSSFGDRKPRFDDDRGSRSGARTSLLPKSPRRF